jgi:hypothetical protein
LEKIREYEVEIASKNRWFVSAKINTDEGRQLNEERTKLINENRRIVIDISNLLEESSEREIKEIKDYELPNSIKIIDENSDGKIRVLSLIEAVKKTTLKVSPKLKTKRKEIDEILDYKFTQILREIKSTLEKEIKYLKLKLDDADEYLENADDVLANKNQTITQLNQENENLRDELEENLTTKNNLQNRLNTLLNQKQVLQHKLSQASEKANDLTTE